MTQNGIVETNAPDQRQESDDNISTDKNATLKYNKTIDATAQSIGSPSSSSSPLALLSVVALIVALVFSAWTSLQQGQLGDRSPSRGLFESLQSIYHRARLPFSPDNYHGESINQRYFEGWYFKVSDSNAKNSLAIVPGIFYGPERHESGVGLPPKSQQSHAFIFVSVNGEHAHYYRFPLSEFRASPDRFEVSIGPNRFSAEGLIMSLEPGIDDDAEISISANLALVNRKPWPVTPFSLGAMGPLAWLPVLECYHGVVSFDHEVHGQVYVNGKMIDLNDGRGYTEKDWGRQFPSHWIWFQSNHFKKNAEGTSVLISLARVPILGFELPGILIGLWYKGELYRLTSYTGTLVHSLSVSDEQVSLSVRNLWYRLDVRIDRRGLSYANLYGPKNGSMVLYVPESLGAKAELSFFQRSGLLGLGDWDLVFSDEASNGGLEVVGDINQLIEMFLWRPI